jgi:hypothetical protein
MKTHANWFCAYWYSENSKWTVAYVFFYLGGCPWELIICLLEVLKNQFVEFDETMFQRDRRPYEHFLHAEHKKKRI